MAKKVTKKTSKKAPSKKATPKRNEQTSKKVASKASKLMSHPNKKVRSVAASALTQAADKPKATKPAKKATRKKAR